MKTILILEDNAREMERLVKIVREQGTQNEVICAVNLEQAYHMAMEKSGRTKPEGCSDREA